MPLPLADIAVLVFLVSGGVASALLHKLTGAAAAAGILSGFGIYKGCGYTGIAMLATFFMLGTIASGWHANQKQVAGIAEENKGRRRAGQVIANAGIAGICSLLAWQFPQKAGVWQLMVAGSFSAATADTLSSELGNIYGHYYYNITTFKKDQRGLNGVVSLEGTLCGIVGSIIIASIYAIGFGWNKTFLGIIIAGTVGNLADSVLGATWERQGYLGNNAVNFLNTLTGAVVCLMFS